MRYLIVCAQLLAVKLRLWLTRKKVVRKPDPNYRTPPAPGGFCLGHPRASESRQWPGSN